MPGPDGRTARTARVVEGSCGANKQEKSALSLAAINDRLNSRHARALHATSQLCDQEGCPPSVLDEITEFPFIDLPDAYLDLIKDGRAPVVVRRYDRM